MLGKLMAFAVVALLFAVSVNASSPTQINAFQNGNIIKLVYYDNFTCFPAPYTIYSNSNESINASSVTACEYGSSIGVNTSGGIPRWSIIPTFAGLSVYGYTAYGSTPQGYATYNGQVIPTTCGAGQASKVCIHRPMYIYSPIISAIEHSINISNGMYGLPEGVLPNPTRDVIVSPKKNGSVSRSYDVRVWVFDPNIFPNSTTGKCTQVVPSSLGDPTAHCLNSTAALQAAIRTNDTAVPVINANNIFWKIANRPETQVAIVTAVEVQSNSTEPQFAVQLSDDINISNTNMFIYSFVGNGNQTIPTTTIPQEQQYPSASSTLIPAALIIMAVVAAWYLARGKLWGAKKVRRK